MANILVTSEYFCKFDGLARKMLIDAGHTVIDNPYGHKRLTPEEIIPYVENADAFICDLEKINAEVIAKAKNLKIIARRGVGVDSVDLNACKARKIEVARCVGLVEQPVAELVMSYILGFSRKIASLSNDMHEGEWNKVIGNSLFGKTLGLVGFGNIAKEVYKRAKAFSMNVVYYDIQKADETQYDIKYLELDELLKQSDFVSLHVPLIESTKNMINEKTLAMMKPSAYLINTARGGIVDELALAKAIENQIIAGAGVDVFDVEPKIDSPLKKYSNVFLTPHVATFTIETFIAMDRRSSENIINYFKEKK